MLKIIINNSDTFQEKALSQRLETKPTTLKPSFQDPFLFDFQETSANLYDFQANDFDHELSCKITLERKEIFVYLGEGGEEENLVPVITCDFPLLMLKKVKRKSLEMTTFTP